MEHEINTSERKVGGILIYFTTWCGCICDFVVQSQSIPNLEGAKKAWDCGYDFESNGSIALAIQPRRLHKLAKGVRIEREICRNIDEMNSALVGDIAEAKLSATKLIRSLRKEKKARAELEGVCYCLVREMEARKAEIRALRVQQERIRREVKEERKMLQAAEVWREEQAQMKLAEANFILEDKYAEVNRLISDLRAFFTSSSPNAGPNVSTKAEILRQVFSLVNNQGVKASIPDSGTATRGQRLVNTMKTPYVPNYSNHKSEATEICSVKTKGNGSSIRSTDRRNPHVVRAMKGHVEWPWRMREAKLESQKMPLRNKA